MKCLILLVLSLASIAAWAELDLNENGVSEIWELQHPEITPGGEDSDGDGFSNYEESIAGTNPSDFHSRLELKVIGGVGETKKAQWETIAGKAYRIEKMLNEEWTEVASFLPRPYPATRSFILPDGSGDILRIVAQDIDLDSDGLSAWEEYELGWSDADASSSGVLGRLDYAAALRSIEQESGAELARGENLPQRLPARLEASRFLMQASFGPTDAEIASVMSLGLGGWIDHQMGMTQTRSSQTMWRNGIGASAQLWTTSWWKLAHTSPDQLRQRIAYSLSQIFVVNYEPGNWIGNNPLIQASYYDKLAEQSFGSYRDLLESITYSPVMGFTLSHLKNRKSDPEIGRFPDENFAREIMQLFSIGLWELNPDGTRKVDEEGLDIPTYDNGTIREMAKIFTGMSFSKTGVNNDEVTFTTPVGGNAHLFPMRVFDEEHEEGPKSLLNGLVLNSDETELLSGEQEVQMTLDMLDSHPNTAPFISHLLIQRLTSSNPSPEYIKRVVDAWLMKGLELKDNLSRVIEAILLDPEVRSPSEKDLGKVREPLIRALSFYRAFDFKDADGNYQFPAKELQSKLGQYAMLSPTVFNFYLPAYSPPGELSDLELKSPELQIADAVGLLSTDNFFQSSIDLGFKGTTGDFSALLSVAHDPGQLLDRISGYLCSRSLSPETRAILIQALNNEPGDAKRVRTALHLVAVSPEAAILK